jgi:Protein of unknown function (DUF2971)
MAKADASNMTEYFYRYRPIKAVLDTFHELENQEIYFSTVDELNDPMEGYKDIFWSGDAIVWRNLLKHYVLCLLQTASYCLVVGEQFDPNIIRNIVFWVPQQLPEAPIRDIYQRVLTEFLSEPAVQKFLSLMPDRTTPIRRTELTIYLRALHGLAMQTVHKEYRERGLLPLQVQGPPAPLPENLTRSAIAMMEGVTKITSTQYPPERIYEALSAVSEAAFAQAQLVNEYNISNREGQIPIIFLAFHFPAAYVSALDRLVHRDWYVACFAKTAEDHSMWSNYADGHRGVSLMFKASPNAGNIPTLSIERVIGASGSADKTITYISGNVAHELKAVNYMAKYPAIDFFRSLGSTSEMYMNNFWYLGEDGSSFSKCRDAVYADHDGWRSGYWQTFEESALCKTPEWAHEEEYRIVVHSGFDMSTKEKRKLKYKFQDLAGIVFGARTEISDKIKIMRVIYAKCAKENRTDFKFFEIRYLPTESRFQLFPLDLLRPSAVPLGSITPHSVNVAPARGAP